MQPTLSIIGCGITGRSLGALWRRQQTFKLQELCSRTLDSALSARDFIGAGSVKKSITALSAANVFLISTTDDQIEIAAKELASHCVVRAGDLVFHCSGALTSSALSSLQEQGAWTASVHPIKSFATADSVVESFSGTFCAMEGEQKALNRLKPAFESIGAQVISIAPEKKVLYHASMSLLCNYLCALMDIGLECLESSGMPRDQAKHAIKPLTQETLGNIFSMDTTDALTGPIARGDLQTLKNQIEAIACFAPEHSPLFSALSSQALTIAQRKKNTEEHKQIQKFLANL